MKKGRIFGVLLLALALFGFWMWARSLSLTDGGPVEGEFTITAFPVGKADALLVQEGNRAVLVDTGEEEDGPYLLKELRERGVDRLDLLLVSHFDKDHVGSAAYLMENLEIQTVLMPDYEGDRPEYEAFLERLEGHPDARRLTDPQKLQIGAQEWVIYPAEDPVEIQDTDGEYDNDMSLVASITYGSRKFLLTGDIEKTRIRQMLAMDVDWRHDWIKMPHHGRYQKALQDLLDAVQPSQAVICCSSEESAEEKTLEQLKKRHIQFWDTSEKIVVTVSDGERIRANYE